MLVNEFPGLDLARRISGRHSRLVDAGDTPERDPLADLQTALKLLRHMRLVNRYAYRADRDALAEQLGLTHAQIERALRPRMGGSVGFPAYKLARQARRVKALVRRVRTVPLSF